MFLVVYVLGLVAAFVWHPIYGLYTYLWAFYLHPPTRWWGAALPDLRWSLIAAIVTLIATWHLKTDRTRPPWYGNLPIKLLMVYTAWMWIQSFWALDPGEHQFGVILFTKYIMLFYLIYSNVDDEEKLKRFCLAHIAGCFYFGYLAYTATGFDDGRLEGVGGPGVDDSNTLGMHVITGLVFASPLLLTTHGWVRWFVFAAIPFLLNTIIVTRSRSTFLGLVIAALAIYYLKPPVYRKWFYVLAVLGGILFVRLAPVQYWDRVNTVTAAVDKEKEMDTSAASRSVVINAQWEMAKDYPLGGGHNSTTYLSPRYMDKVYLSEGGRSSHNTFMTTLVDQGFPGAVIYTAMVIWICMVLYDLRAMDSAGLPSTLGFYRAIVGASLAAIFVSGLFVNYLKAEVQLWCVALLVVVRELCRNAIQRQREESITQGEESITQGEESITQAQQVG
jgi:hypothetical protein